MAAEAVAERLSQVPARYWSAQLRVARQSQQARIAQVPVPMPRSPELRQFAARPLQVWNLDQPAQEREPAASPAAEQLAVALLVSSPETSRGQSPHSRSNAARRSQSGAVVPAVGVQAPCPQSGELPLVAAESFAAGGPPWLAKSSRVSAMRLALEQPVHRRRFADRRCRCWPRAETHPASLPQLAVPASNGA